MSRGDRRERDKAREERERERDRLLQEEVDRLTASAGCCAGATGTAESSWHSAFLLWPTGVLVN